MPGFKRETGVEILRVVSEFRRLEPLLRQLEATGIPRATPPAGASVVSVRVTGDRISPEVDEGLYPGTFVYRDDRNGAWLDGTDCLVADINSGTLETGTRYEGYVASVKQRGDPDVPEAYEGWPVVIVLLGSGSGTFYASCGGGADTTGYAFTQIALTGPNSWVAVPDGITGTAFRAQSNATVTGSPPAIPAGQTIEVRAYSYPPLDLAVAYTATAGTVAFGTVTSSGTPGPFAYAWSFGDATTSALHTPTHVYAGPGPYTVSVTVTDSGYTPPRVQTFTFVVPDTDGGSVTPAVAGGGPQTAYGCSPWGGMTSITAVTKTYCDVDEESNPILIDIKHRIWGRDLFLEPLVPDLAADYDATDCDVTLLPAPSGGDPPYTYGVDWGDGTTNALLTHTYAASGTYSVTLTATGDDGGVSSPVVLSVTVAC